MPLLDSLARLLDAVAWPAAVFLIAWVLRDPLSELIRGLRRLRYKDFGAEFGRKVQELEFKADEADLPRGVEEAGPERLAAISPRAAVTEAWRQVEVALRQFAQERGLRDRQSTWRIAQELTDQGVLSPSTMGLLDDMKTLRNEAVHAQELDLSPADALEYADLAQRVKYSVVSPST